MVKILADSFNVATGDRITTFVIDRFPKPLLAELGTHRMFSRNAASSRAIPIAKVIQRIKEDPYIPIFTKNQKGMQGKVGDRIFQIAARNEYLKAMKAAIAQAEVMDKLGVHKQNTNRILEPYMYVPVIITATEWENYFNLRCDEATHPDFRLLARQMKDLYINNEPKELNPGEWHIPFSDGLINREKFSLQESLMIASARAARISYTTHDGKFDFDCDFDLHDMLVEDGHYSPLEHSAMAVNHKNKEFPEYSKIKSCIEINTRNYRGWFSYRAHIETGIAIN